MTPEDEAAAVHLQQKTGDELHQINTKINQAVNNYKKMAANTKPHAELLASRTDLVDVLVNMKSQKGVFNASRTDETGKQLPPGDKFLNVLIGIQNELAVDNDDVLSEEVVAELQQAVAAINSCITASKNKAKKIKHTEHKNAIGQEIWECVCSAVKQVETLNTALSNFRSIAVQQPVMLKTASQEMDDYTLGSESDDDGDDGPGPGDSGDERGAGRMNKKRKRVVDEDDAALPEGGGSSSSAAAAIPIASAVPQMLSGLFGSSPARK